MIQQLTPYYCPETAVHIVLPIDRIVLDETRDWYVIGFPGVDGIEFRMSATETDAAVFAFYPIESRYVKVADSPDDLITRWKLDKVIL
jgi:hypothetical protein